MHIPIEIFHHAYEWLGRKDLFQVFPDEVTTDENQIRDIEEIRQILDEKPRKRGGDMLAALLRRPKDQAPDLLTSKLFNEDTFYPVLTKDLNKCGSELVVETLYIK